MSCGREGVEEDGAKSPYFLVFVVCRDVGVAESASYTTPLEIVSRMYLPTPQRRSALLQKTTTTADPYCRSGKADLYHCVYRIIDGWVSDILAWTPCYWAFSPSCKIHRACFPSAALEGRLSERPVRPPRLFLRTPSDLILDPRATSLVPSCLRPRKRTHVFRPHLHAVGTPKLHPLSMQNHRGSCSFLLL